MRNKSIADRSASQNIIVCRNFRAYCAVGMYIPTSQPREILKATPVIDYYPLGGFTEKSEGMFIVLNGGIPEVKESLNNIVVKKAVQPSTFSISDDMNLVVFGVFSVQAGTG